MHLRELLLCSDRGRPAWRQFGKLFLQQHQQQRRFMRCEILLRCRPFRCGDVVAVAAAACTALALFCHWHDGSKSRHSMAASPATTKRSRGWPWARGVGIACSPDVEEGEKGGAQFDDEHTRLILFQDPTLPNSRKAALVEGPSPQLGMVATFRAFWLL